MAGFWRALHQPSLRRLAPVWLCVNAVVGLWLGPTLTFLLTERVQGTQLLAGILADQPERMGWLLLGYSLVFGAGVSAWSVILPRVPILHALRVNIAAMLAVCVGLLLLNHSGGQSQAVRWVMGIVSALCVMVESGFTPAALSLLAGAVGAQAGREADGHLFGTAEHRRDCRVANRGSAGQSICGGWSHLRHSGTGFNRDGFAGPAPSSGGRRCRCVVRFGDRGRRFRRFDGRWLRGTARGKSSSGREEPNRGDCTWTGCVPSKALLKAAKVAHEIRTASRFGISTNPPVVEMANVRAHVRHAIEQVYRFESAEELHKPGIEVMQGAARFVNSQNIQVGDQLVHGRAFLLTTGARPRIPIIEGLREVPFLTYGQIFDTDRLPPSMIVIGGGPIGMEMAQAYQRLGASVTVVADRLLPKDEPEAREVIRQVFEREGIRFVWGRAKSARKQADEIVVATDGEQVRGDLLLIASGRQPTVAGLDLEKAGVAYSEKGISVDSRLRTNVKHIYAAGDVTGGYQFTHFAGRQAFQATRNALLPGSSSGLTDLVPWVTFTDPEVAHVGLTEAQAKSKFGENVTICRWEMTRTDRAVCEDDRDGFIELITEKEGLLLGATVVNARAGETITEFIVAMKHGLKVSDLAGAIHAYPTYSTPVQQLAGEMATEHTLAGVSGKIIRFQDHSLGAL